MFELATGLIAEHIGLAAHILNTVERFPIDSKLIWLNSMVFSLFRFIDDSQIQLELNQFQASRRLNEQQLMNRSFCEFTLSFINISVSKWFAEPKQTRTIRAGAGRLRLERAFYPFSFCRFS